MQSSYKVLSAEAATKHGPRPSMVVFDELHVQPNRRLFDTLRAGVGKRPSSLFIMLTTAGEYDEESLCWQEHEYATAVLKGEISDPAYYAVVYSANRDDDPGALATWKKANPNYGVTVSHEDLADQYRRARHIPEELASFKQLRLNIWCQSSEGVIDLIAWKECSAEPLCEGPCYIGIDLSSKLDLTAVVAYFPQTHSILAHFWIPAENIEDRKRRKGGEPARLAAEAAKRRDFPARPIP